MATLHRLICLLFDHDWSQTYHDIEFPVNYPHDDISCRRCDFVRPRIRIT